MRKRLKDWDWRKAALVCAFSWTDDELEFEPVQSSLVDDACTWVGMRLCVNV